MELPEAKWLNWYSCLIIVVSAIETGVFVSGGLLEIVAMSAFSCMTIILGLVASSFVICGHFAFAKLTRSITGPKYAQNIENIVTILFWFGVVAAGAVVFTYPILGNNSMPLSMAPVGIGLSVGARWIYSKYHRSEANSPNQANAADAKGRAAD